MTHDTALTIDEAMEVTGLNRAQLVRRIQAGLLRANYVGSGRQKRYRIDADDLQDFLSAGQDRPVTNGERMLGVTEVAVALGFSADTVRKMCASGALPNLKGPGAKGHYRIPVHAVNELLAKAGQPPL